MDLAEFWDKKVLGGDKHFKSDMRQKKMDRLLLGVEKNFFPCIDFSQVDVILDWGCGGGLFTKMLSKYGKVVALDIAQSSLNECMSVAGKHLYDSILFPSNPEDFELPDYQVDLIWSHSVIHHFPSYSYWAQIAKIWKEISPKYIAAQIKIGKTSGEKDYFAGKNYVNGLLMSPDGFVGQFPGYHCVSFLMEKAVKSDSRLGYFVLRKGG